MLLRIPPRESKPCFGPVWNARTLKEGDARFHPKRTRSRAASVKKGVTIYDYTYV